MQLNEDTLSQVRATVMHASGSNLNSSNFELSLFNQHKITHPTLQIDQRMISFGREVLYMHSAPTGISFTPGKDYAYALYVIPISGNIEISNKIMRSVSNIDTFNISSDGRLFYKEFAVNVDTDEEVQKQVAKNAFDKINTAKSMFENAKGQSDTYNETLKAFIYEVTEEEREKRKKASDSMRNLDPFA